MKQTRLKGDLNKNIYRDQDLKSYVFRHSLT